MSRTTEYSGKGKNHPMQPLPMTSKHHSVAVCSLHLVLVLLFYFIFLLCLSGSLPNFHSDLCEQEGT